MLARARTVIVVADSSKVGRVHLARIAGVDQVDEIITDASADPDTVARLRARTTVTLAGAPGPAAVGLASVVPVGSPRRERA